MIWWCLGNLETVWSNNFGWKSQDSQGLGERGRLKKIFDIECSKGGGHCCGRSHKSQEYVQLPTSFNLVYLAICCATTYIKSTWKHFQVLGLGLLYHHVPPWTVKRYRFSELIQVFDKKVFRWSWMSDGVWDSGMVGQVLKNDVEWAPMGPGRGTRDLGCAHVKLLVLIVAVCLSDLVSIEPLVFCGFCLSYIVWYWLIVWYWPTCLDGTGPHRNLSLHFLRGLLEPWVFCQSSLRVKSLASLVMGSGGCSFTDNL